SYIAPRLQAILDPGLTFRYVGRGESASTAEGMHSLHAREQQRILREAVAGVVVSTIR
ncbi:MAG: hypothetical protein EOM24_28165, partial [Chloroflexia bacterium]|nr:hypothetical protein [Chloroflexia bacterium]